MSSLPNKFFENKWVRIGLYFVSLLVIGGTLFKGLAEGNWPESFSEMLIPLLLAAYVVLDMLRMREKKRELSEEEEGKIDEIGKT